MLAESLVVEQNAGDHQRPRERPAPGLVRARDIADTELAIVREKPLAGGGAGSLAADAAEDSATDAARAAVWRRHEMARRLFKRATGRG